MDKLIKINNEHYIICNNDIINEGDWLLDMTDNTIWDCHKDMPNSLFPECKKITHSTQPLESIVTENSFKSYEFIPLQEVKELIGEVDVENRAESRFGTDIDSIRGSKEYDLNTDLKRGFVSKPLKITRRRNIQKHK